MELVIAILTKLFDIVVTVCFGIVFVPLFGLFTSPLAGVGVIAALGAAIPIARRYVAPGAWRREFGWSLLMPGVGLWLRRRLVAEEPAAADLALRLAVIGGVAMLVLSTILNSLALSSYAQELHQAMQSEESAVAYMQREARRVPLETYQRSRRMRMLSAHQRRRFERAWRTTEREHWRTQIHNRAENLPLGPA